MRVPEGVLRTNTMGRPWVEQRSRPRRNRKSEAMRKMVRENSLHPSDFIYPLFIHDESSNVAIASMPGCERHSLASMVAEAKDAWQYGVRTFVVFPKVPDAVKTNRGEEAYNPDGIVPRAVQMLKEALPDSIVCTDVALDPYSVRTATRSPLNPAAVPSPSLSYAAQRRTGEARVHVSILCS